MGTLIHFLFVYTLGGLTFLPLVLGLSLLYAHYTLPRVNEETTARRAAESLRDADSADEKTLAHEFKKTIDSDVAEGYFAVCREYVPGGVNGKPPERTTPAGEVIGEESPSVYQSMYRSLFDRKQQPSLDPSKYAGRFTKKPSNVFYVVLRHGHLMLYDDAAQVEVRHVISLAHHDVSLYAGGNEVPEGELWIKRNAIRLSRKTSNSDTTSTSKPFFLFSENCSDKEDFYFALLQNQERSDRDSDAPPKVQKYEVKDAITLVQKLHSSEEQLQSRWLNALLGRLFLGMYKTQFVEDLIRMKITKKIARVKKPFFLTGIVLKNIDMGESLPLITNPKLKDLTVDGNCCVEADVKYNGNFRIEIAATVRIDLGTRFKAREVQLILAAKLKRLEGHILFRCKPPPSNRLWFSFETMPHLEMSIEPIVSSRQITYSVILKALESRVREVFAETLVAPHWDDIAFLDTMKHRFRGGIWEEDSQASYQQPETQIPDETPEDEVEAGISALDSSAFTAASDRRSASTPVLVDSSTRTGLFSRNVHRTPTTLSGLEIDGSVPGTQRPLNIPTSTPDMPRVLRSTSFASAADPVLSTNLASGLAGRSNLTTGKDMVSYVTGISNRSQSNLAVETPLGISPRPETSSVHSKSGSISSEISSSTESVHELSSSDVTFSSSHQIARSASPSSIDRSSIKSTTSSADYTTSHGSSRLQALASKLVPSEGKQQQLASFGAAAAAAKSWTWSKKRTSTILPPPHEPYGRGRPLPPPGQPLPPPDRAATFAASLIKRKWPVPQPSLPDTQQDYHKSEETKTKSLAPPPLPAKRLSRHLEHDDATHDDVFVVSAPLDSDSHMSDDDIHVGVAYMKAGSENGGELPTPIANSHRDGLDRTFSSDAPQEGVVKCWD